MLSKSGTNYILDQFNAFKKINYRILTTNYLFFFKQNPLALKGCLNRWSHEKINIIDKFKEIIVNQICQACSSQLQILNYYKINYNNLK